LFCTWLTLHFFISLRLVFTVCLFFGI
jgi:hypothetical protein